MPYVSKEKADHLDLWSPGYLIENERGEALEVNITSAGELGYVVGAACKEFLEYKIQADDNGELRYQYICDVIGTLESLKLDLMRVVGFPYEEAVEARNNTFHWDI